MAKPAAPGALIQIAALAQPLVLADGTVARDVKLLPIGRVDMRDGRGPYVVRDRAHAEAIVAATKQWLGGADFCLDYDHQVLATAKHDGATAIAAGWCRKDNLVVRDDGIWATGIEWTPAALQRLEAREYRYISPLFMARKDDGAVAMIKNASLVNIGAIDLPAVAAGLSGEHEMDLTALAAALGLAADATAEQIAAAAAALKARADAVPAAAALQPVAASLGLKPDATTDEVVAAIGALRAAGQDMVPASVVDGLKAQLGELVEDKLSREVDEMVAAGIVLPAKRDDVLAWFRSDAPAARKFFAGMPAVVAAGAVLAARAPEKSTSLTADEIAACAAIGLSHEDFLAAKNEGIN